MKPREQVTCEWETWEQLIDRFVASDRSPGITDRHMDTYYDSRTADSALNTLINTT